MSKTLYIFTFFLLPLLPLSCSEVGTGANTFEVFGSVAGNTGQSAKILAVTGNGDALVLDSTGITNGKFTLTATLSKPDPAYLLSDETSEVPVFMTAGKVQIHIDTARRFNSDDTLLLLPEFKNGALNTLYMEYLTVTDSLENLPEFSSLDALYEKYNNALYQKDSAAVLDYGARLGALSNSLQQRMERYQIDFATKNATSVLAPYIIYEETLLFEDADYSIAEQQRIVNTLTDNLQGNWYYEACHRELNTLKRLAKGKKAPDFRLATPDGSPLALSDFKGKIVLLDFWAHWCAPCTDNFPNLRRLREKYGTENFEIIGISDDTDAFQWKSAIAAHGLSWPQVIANVPEDETPSISKKYNINYLPTTYLVDEKGYILAKDLTFTELDTLLQKLLRPSAIPSL